ncbi:MAG: hypothetical protein ACKVOP_00910 [Sphingomonadaceae bacterium]
MTAKQTGSRPMRALAAILGTWIAVRIAMLLPVAAQGPPSPSLPIASTTTTFAEAPAQAPPALRLTQAAVRPERSRGTVAGRVPRLRPLRSEVILSGWDASQSKGAATPATGLTQTLERVPSRPASQPIPAVPVLDPEERSVSNRRVRISGSGWALARAGGGQASLAAGGQLGGSQAGLRLYAARDRGVLAVTTLVSAPLGQARGRYGAIGLALRDRAVGIIVERRIAFDSGARNAVVVTGYGGLYDVKLPEKFRLDGFVQGGTVGGEGFVDGAVRVERTLLEHGRSRLSAGAGAWGGAQSDAARLDIGPQIVARMPIRQTMTRISAEWRERIAGDARPGSGLTITAGVDF